MTRSEIRDAATTEVAWIKLALHRSPRIGLKAMARLRRAGDSNRGLLELPKGQLSALSP
jgi:hypothetical protein